MPPLKSFVKYWLPVIVCMALIFSGSGDQLSWKRSSRIIGPIVYWLFPQLDEPSVERIVLVARKCAHLGEFAVLALLLWRALAKPGLRPGPIWRGSDAWLAFGLAVLYAATDEVHQCFVPSRQGAVRDVLVDAGGAGIGLLLLWLYGRWRKWW